MSRLRVTQTFFVNMMQFLDAEYKRMSTRIRRNFGKANIESASSMGSWLEALLVEVATAHPLGDEVGGNGTP